MPGGGAGAGQLFGTVVSAAQYLGAAQQANNLKQEARKLELSRPKLKRDALADENLNFLKGELSQGISAGAEKAYTDQADKEFSSSLSAILRGGGELNSVGEIYGKGQEGVQKLEMIRDNLRLNQIANVLEQSKYVDERNVVTPFQVNEWAPWADKSQANAVARAQAAKEKNDALNSLVGSVGGMSGGKGPSTDNTTSGSTGGTNLAWQIGSTGQMSDKRLKHNYHIVGKSPSGINIWQFSYLGSNDRYEGVMAQEVPQAAFMTGSGFFAVDYSKIDVQFKIIF